MQAATALFAEMGYSRATLALVADGLGVTRQAFYYHFRNKGDILAALFDRAMTLVETESAKWLTRSASTRYIDLVSGHMRIVIENLSLIKITTHERPSIDELEGVGSVARRVSYARNFTEAYRDGVAAGTLRPAHARVTVQSNFGTVNGLCTWWDPVRGPSATSVHAQLLETLCNGVLMTQ